MDGHSHSDIHALASPESRQKILQGYTTEVLGLDGLSVAPISDNNKKGWQKHLSGLAGKTQVAWTWNSFKEYLDTVDAAKPAANVCSYAGLGAIRLAVMGMTDRAPAEQELEAMRALTARCMEEGARGLSAGLIYAPGSYQSLDEMAELRKVAAARQNHPGQITPSRPGTRKINTMPPGRGDGLPAPRPKK